MTIEIRGRGRNLMLAAIALAVLLLGTAACGGGGRNSSGGNSASEANEQASSRDEAKEILDMAVTEVERYEDLLRYYINDGELVANFLVVNA